MTPLIAKSNVGRWNLGIAGIGKIESPRRRPGDRACKLRRSPREEKRPRKRRARALLRRQALGDGDKPVAAASGR